MTQLVNDYQYLVKTQDDINQSRIELLNEILKEYTYRDLIDPCDLNRSNVIEINDNLYYFYYEDDQTLKKVEIIE